jgi:hypothetical protein
VAVSHRVASNCRGAMRQGARDPSLDFGAALRLPKSKPTIRERRSRATKGEQRETETSEGSQLPVRLQHHLCHLQWLHESRESTVLELILRASCLSSIRSSSIRCNEPVIRSSWAALKRLSSSHVNRLGLWMCMHSLIPPC